MTSDTLIEDDSSNRARIIQSYVSLDAARAAQKRFESQSLISELGAALGEWGLHFAPTRTDVEDMLRQGAPVDGVREIVYEDDLQHWETPLLTAFIDERMEVVAALIDQGADVDAPNMVIYASGDGFGHTALHMLVVRGDLAGVRQA